MNCHIAATLKCLRQSVLVIGYDTPVDEGNAVGPQIAKAIAAWRMPNVEAVAVDQLTPELIERLADVDRVIFVNGYFATSDQAIEIHPVDLASAKRAIEGDSEPQMLLAKTQACYGYHPHAICVSVPVVNVGLSSNLPRLEQARLSQEIEIALEEIESLIKAPLALLQAVGGYKIA